MTTPFAFLNNYGQLECEESSLCTTDGSGNPVPYCYLHSASDMCVSLNSNPNVKVLGCYNDSTCGGNASKISPPVVPVVPVVQVVPIVPVPAQPVSPPGTTTTTTTTKKKKFYKQWWFIMMIVITSILFMIVFFLIIRHVRRAQQTPPAPLVVPLARPAPLAPLARPAPLAPPRRVQLKTISKRIVPRV